MRAAINGHVAFYNDYIVAYIIVRNSTKVHVIRMVYAYFIRLFDHILCCLNSNEDKQLDYNDYIVAYIIVRNSTKVIIVYLTGWYMHTLYGYLIIFYAA